MLSYLTFAPRRPFGGLLYRLQLHPYSLHIPRPSKQQQARRQKQRTSQPVTRRRTHWVTAATMSLRVRCSSCVAASYSRISTQAARSRPWSFWGCSPGGMLSNFRIWAPRPGWGVRGYEPGNQCSPKGEKRPYVWPKMPSRRQTPDPSDAG